MRIDKNVKAEEVKEKMMQSLEKMNQKYTSEAPKELENNNSDDTESESNSSKVRFGWK